MEEILGVDAEGLMPEEPVVPMTEEPKKPKSSLKRKVVETSETTDELVNCLRNERITVRYVINEKTGITDKRHPFYGGLADGAIIAIVVPLLRNGSLKNPLTKAEKQYLEYAMGLDDNALSVHKTTDNYWENYQVRLGKGDYILDLSTPKGYIDYKVLLANSDIVAPSVAELQSNPKATYRYVLISDKEEYDATSTKVKAKEKCMELYFKYRESPEHLRCVVQSYSGRPVDKKTDISFLKKKCMEYIESDPQKLEHIFNDVYLDAKVLLTKATDAGVITRRGTWYLYEGEVLSTNEEEPTFSVAARFLADKRNQEIKFSIENKLK